MQKDVVHYATNIMKDGNMKWGGSRCGLTMHSPWITDNISKVTCKSCLDYLKVKNRAKKKLGTQNTSNNTAITKLPTFGDVYLPLDDAGENREICLDFYQEMCRQFRNS